MNDATQTAAPASTPGGKGSGKSPLDVLEEILQENKGAGDAGGASGPTQDKGAEPEQVVDPAEQARIEQQIAQRQLLDQEQIQQQLEELRTIADTPQNQARIEQRQQEEEQHHKAALDADGHQIRQLDHTKIEVSE